MGSQLCGKIAMLVPKVTLKKSGKSEEEKNIKLKNLKVQFFPIYFLDTLSPCFHKSETIFSKQFFLNYFFHI